MDFTRKKRCLKQITDILAHYIKKTKIYVYQTPATFSFYFVLEPVKSGIVCRRAVRSNLTSLSRMSFVGFPIKEPLSDETTYYFFLVKNLIFTCTIFTIFSLVVSPKHIVQVTVKTASTYFFLIFKGPGPQSTNMLSQFCLKLYILLPKHFSKKFYDFINRRGEKTRQQNELKLKLLTYAI